MLKKHLSHSSPKVNRGFSITELLIGSAAGIIVVGGALALVVAIIGSNSDTIKSSRLNQDLNAIMAIMVNEVRRAGYNGDLATPFSAGGSLDTTSSCVHYAYAGDGDLTDGDTAEDDVLHYGFRWGTNGTGDLIQMTSSRTVSFTCSAFGSSTWEAVNDNNEVQITSFVVADNSLCLDNDGSVIACGDATAEIRIRQLGLTLAGQLTNDTAVNSTVQETVRIRNIDPL